MIDPTKPLTTQGGHDVRDVHRLSEPVSGYEWMGLCQVRDSGAWCQVGDSGAWCPVLWTMEGCCQGRSNAYTLMNEPEEVELFVNLYLAGSEKKHNHSSHSTKDKALATVERSPYLEHLTIAFPVKIPVGYGVGGNEDE